MGYYYALLLLFCEIINNIRYSLITEVSLQKIVENNGIL